MSAGQMLETSVLLGVFVLLAGGYGLLYGLGRLRHRRELVLAGFVTFGLQCATVLAVVMFTPLLAGWKAFIALSCLVYLFIPPVTWRYLTMLHRLEERQS
jgi:hypothetical protein